MLAVKRRRFWAFLAALGALSCEAPVKVVAEAAAAQPASTPSARQGARAEPLALLELFTSEGCSSCPPADENLAQITRDATQRGLRIFTLEFHVDYWNYLGWSDPFSSATYGQRQRQYARPGATGVYTPQLVVNGTEEFVGSDRARSRAAITRALSTPALARVSIEARRKDGGFQVNYGVDAPKAVELQLAVAEDAVETHVARGENANRLLRHRHVVRAFQTLPTSAQATGTWQAPWPSTAKRSSVFVVAYATDTRTQAVIGAAAVTLPAEP